VRFLERQYHGEVTLEIEREITLQGCVGRETVYEQMKGSRSVRVYGRWYISDGRIYEVAWMPSRGEPPQEARRMVWDSFRLLEPGS
jgi:hypothetical protein